MDTLGKDPAFIDPWGNEYVYEFPREDGAMDMLFSMGPDGKTTEGYTEDDIRWKPYSCPIKPLSMRRLRVSFEQQVVGLSRFSISKKSMSLRVLSNSCLS